MGKNLQELARSCILDLRPYKGGKPIPEVEREVGITGAVKMASNENPLGPSPRALEAISRYLLNIHYYPDGSGYYLKEKLSRLWGLKPSQFIIGNGTNEIIELMVRAFLNPGEEAIIAEPSFVVYRMVVKIMDGVPVMIGLRNFTHDLPAMANAVTPCTKLVFICNPNNPTGTVVSHDEVKDFMGKIPEDIMVVFDEAYYEYVEREDFPLTLDYILQSRNVIILRTFSKVYGLAGLRIGYGIAREEMVELLDKIRQPFNVNALAQEAALAGLDDEEHVRKSQEVNRLGKRFLYQAFEKLGLSYVPSQANFVLVDFGREASEICQRLLYEGIILRPMTGFNLPANFVRITIGTEEHNQRLFSALKKILI